MAAAIYKGLRLGYGCKILRYIDANGDATPNKI